MSEWIQILALALQLFHKAEGSNITEIITEWDNTDRIGMYAPAGKQALYITLASAGSKKELCTYILIPWQELYDKTNDTSFAALSMLYEFITVNEFAIVYRYQPPSIPEDFRGMVKKFTQYAGTLFAASDGNKILNEQQGISTPDSVRIIQLREYPFYTVQEVAVPGSAAVNPDVKEPLIPGKMTRQILVPDQGPVKSSWIVNGSPSLETCAIKKDIGFRKIFTDNLKMCLADPSQKDNLYDLAKDEIIAASSDCNDSGATELRMTTILKRCLNKKESRNYISAEELFADYQPKTTPDVATDYMYELVSEFRIVPPADTSNAEDLLGLFKIYYKAAKRNPGKWEDGNMILGAKPKEYIPTKEELVLDEIGERIRKVAESCKPQTLAEKTKVKMPKKIKYRHFTFTHSDVMGSGRFFYVDKIEDVILTLK